MKNCTSKKTTAALVGAGLAAFSLAANATVIDLTSNDSGTLNGAQFDWTATRPTGTGVLDPFVRIQANATEQGYNTSGGAPFDDKAGIWTHDIQFSDLQSTEVTIGGTAYFKLQLDVNEPGGNKSFISLDQLEFYTSSTGSQTTTDVASLGALRWSLDGAGESYLLLDASRNSGSGSGDMLAYIPVSAFAGAKGSDFVYLFSRFGDQVTADGSTEGGFEEWALVKSLTPVPEVGALYPIVGLLAAVGFTHLLRRRRMTQLALAKIED